MTLLTFEDFSQGDIFSFGHRPVSRADILAFAQEFDPQPFHLDEAAGQDSLLGGLAASGWHTACLLMRMSCDAWVNASASWGGPGVEELKWLAPVRPGDVLRARRTVVSARASQSRPEMGLVSLFFEVLNQRDQVVMTQANTVMIGRRGIGLAPAQPASPANTTLVAAASPGQPPLWFEDCVAGTETALGTHPFTRDSIIAFARKYDPQPFHLDEEAGRNSHFGGLVASGWQTACAWMRLNVDARQRGLDALRQQGAPYAASGPSPGVKNIAWRKPVRPGDTISFATTCIEKRAVSRPGWGLVHSHSSGANQHGERVFEFVGAVLMPMRG